MRRKRRQSDEAYAERMRDEERAARVTLVWRDQDDARKGLIASLCAAPRATLGPHAMAGAAYPGQHIERKDR